MKLDRLEVSGGFLDGLRLPFAPGLNVLIGPRGAGKTSVLELLRFALGIPAMTSEADEAAREQAFAVLGDGTVTLYALVQGEPLVFTRTALDEAPAASASYQYLAPLIVSQSEIEAIGLNPTSRREILDRLIDPLAWSEVDLSSPLGEVASLERRIERLREEREEFADKGGRSADLAAALKEAEAEQKTVAKTARKVDSLQKSTAKLADELGQLRSAGDGYRITEEMLEGWQEEITETEVERPFPSLASAPVEAQVTKRTSKAEEHIRLALEQLSSAAEVVSEARSEAVGRQQKLQKKLRAESERLEELQEGAGEVSRRVSALRQEIKAEEGFDKRVRQLDKQIRKVVAERESALDRAEQTAEKRFSMRQACAGELTARFNGRIEVRVDKSGETAAYEAALVDALQGSNLQYKSLAGKLATQVSPRELISAVESSDATRLAQLAGISDDRAVRLVAHLQQNSMAGLLLAALDDSIDFALLDGQKYKLTKNLSMGQRCTVVLPLLLAEEHESILLDQPEDHLDNAFIVDTLVSAIRARSSNGQVIVATHNANIPVLGDAAQVVVLASDGRHGFIDAVAALDADESVEAITTLMEGGREAFARRAEFYSAHPDAR
jgi:chromosome segregation ATPase